MKRFLTILVLLLIGFSLGGQVAWADRDDDEAESTTEDTDGSENTFEENVSACAENFGKFVISLLDTMMFEDYWQDYFVRNRCQQDDIFALDDEAENLLEELRTEYTKQCSSEEITELQNDIRMNKMETYFVRHIVEFKEKSTYKKDEEAAQAAAEQKSDTRYVETISGGTVVDTTNIRIEMKERYVDNKTRSWVETEEEMDILIDGFLSDYEHRIPQYWGCSVSPWEEVADKAKELADTMVALTTMGDLKEGVAEIAQEYKDEKAERQAEKEAQGVQSGGEKDSPPKGLKAIGAFFKKFVQIRVQQIDPPKFLEDIGKEKEEEGEAITFGSLLEEQAVQEETYREAYEGSVMLADYWKLYKVNSGDITTDLVFAIDELSAVLQNSSQVPSFLPGLKQAAKEIHKKQGSGKAGG